MDREHSHLYESLSAIFGFLNLYTTEPRFKEVIAKSSAMTEYMYSSGVKSSTEVDVPAMPPFLKRAIFSTTELVSVWQFNERYP